MEWISAEDRLPKYEVVIGWVYFSDGWVARTGIYIKKNKAFWMDEQRSELKCTHWMPLPDPPKVISK